MKQMQLALVAGVILMLASLNAPALTLEHFWQERLIMIHKFNYTVSN